MPFISLPCVHSSGVHSWLNVFFFFVPGILSLSWWLCVSVLVVVLVVVCVSVLVVVLLSFASRGLSFHAHPNYTSTLLLDRLLSCVFTSS